jgi:hypothetical protein
VADAARAAEAGFWFSPRAETSRRGVFARDGAAPKQAARRGRSKSPFADRTVGVAADEHLVPPSPRASVSPPASARFTSSARAPEPALHRSGTVPVAAAAISPAEPSAAATVDPPPRASPPTPRTSKKKSLLKGKGFETPRRVSDPRGAEALETLERDKNAPPTNVTVLDAAGDELLGGDETETEKVPDVPEPAAEKQKAEEPKGRAEPVAKKPKTLPGASSKKRAARTLVRKKRARKPPVAEPEPEPAADDCEAHAAEAEQVQQETPSPEAPEAPEGVESPASVFDDFEDAFEKAFDASAEFVVRQFEPAPREPLAASSPPGFVADPSPCSRADEVEQRARRAAASEADAWTAAEVPTLFKLSEKASSREERRKWEIILDVVLARAAAKSPSPLPAPSGSEPVFSPDVSPGAKKKRRASPVADRTETETLPFENKKQKRRRVDARAENVAYASSESAGGDAGPVADPVAVAAAGPADDSDDEMASLERRLRSMRTTRKERAEMEIAAMHKQFKEDTHAQAAALEAEAARAEKAAAARRAQAEEKNKKRVARVVDAFAAQHQTFKDAARDAREALEEVEAAYARDLEEAAATTEAERAKLAKRAETLVARAAARAEETSRVVAKKRKDAATGNSLKSLLLRLAEQM